MDAAPETHCENMPKVCIFPGGSADKNFKKRGRYSSPKSIGRRIFVSPSITESVNRNPPRSLDKTLQAPCVCKYLNTTSKFSEPI